MAALPETDTMTLDAAASRLNVSKQFVMRLVDQGVLGAGTTDPESVRTSDVSSYKIQQDLRRDRALDRLAALSEEVQGLRIGIDEQNARSFLR